MLSSSTDPVRWRRLSALLDVGLDLAGADRAAWLRDMASREPDLVDELRQRLADHEASAQAGFLTGVAGPAGGGPGPAASLGGQTRPDPKRNIDHDVERVCKVQIEVGPDPFGVHRIDLSAYQPAPQLRAAELGEVDE